MNPEVEIVDEYIHFSFSLEAHPPKGLVGSTLFDRLHANGDKVRNADNNGHHQHQEHGKLCSGQITCSGATAGIAHKEVAKDGKGDSQPNGHCVNDHTETCKEEHITDGRQAVSLWRWLCAIETVKSQGKWKISEHCESVGNCKASQQAVCTGNHILPGKDHNVKDICNNSKGTDQTGQVTMDVHIPHMESHQPPSPGVVVSGARTQCSGAAVSVNQI